MAYLFSYGCDAQMSMSQKFSVVDASASITADAGKFGAGTDSMKLIDDADFNTITLPATAGILGDTTSPFHMSFYVKLAANPSVETVLIKLIQGSGSCNLLVDTTGALSMTLWTITSGGKITSEAGNISDGSWHHVEFKYVEDNVSGIYKLWIDGVIATDFSGDTLQNSSISTGISNVKIFGVGNITDTEFDDILIWDEEGTTFNTAGQLGLIRIETLIPNGDGNSTQLTPTGAGITNADRVDEEGADGDTTYVASSTTTNKDLYTYTDMVGIPTTIEGAIVHSYASNPDIGPISMKAMVRSVATETSGDTVAVSSGGVYSYKTQVFTLDPNTALAWTVAGINAAEFGVEVV